jgi:hypothetical protein
MLDGVFDVVAEPDGDIVLGTEARLRRIAGRAGTIETIAGNGIASSSGDGGPARSAGLAEVGPLVLDGAGNLYLATAGGLVRRIDAATGTITTAAGDGGRATSASLAWPAGLRYATGRTLVFVDSVNQRLRGVAPDGTIRTIAPDLGAGADLVVAGGEAFVSQPVQARVARVDLATGAVTPLTSRR